MEARNGVPFVNSSLLHMTIKIEGVNLMTNKPKMAYSRDALLERDKRETREIWSYGGWPIIV